VTTTTEAATKAHQQMNAAQAGATDATKNQASAIDQLGQKLKGQASAQADTFTGKLKALTTTIEDQVAAFGNKYGPALQVAGQGVAVLGAAYSGAKSLIDKHRASVAAATAAGEDATKKSGLLSKAIGAVSAAAAGGAAAVAGLAIEVIVIAALIAALIALGYELYKNWGTVWPAIKSTPWMPPTTSATAGTT
jgi:hypothetical protein